MATVDGRSAADLCVLDRFELCRAAVPRVESRTARDGACTGFVVFRERYANLFAIINDERRANLSRYSVRKSDTPALTEATNPQRLQQCCGNWLFGISTSPLSSSPVS